MHIKGYNTSTDYKLLWKLIHEGYRIPAWITYDEEYDIKDLVEVKIYTNSDRYCIGIRGIGYEGLEQNVEHFSLVCKANELVFILPTLPVIGLDDITCNVSMDIEIPLIHEKPTQNT